MSVQDDTQRRTAFTAPVDGCSAMVEEYMDGTQEVRVWFKPAYTMHFDHGLIPDKPVAAVVFVRIGSTVLKFTPEVWAAINDAVREVIPAEVSA